MSVRRKMIDALLLLETMCWRLATLTELFMQTIGQGLRRLLVGRRGPRLLSHREIYARNVLKFWEEHGRPGVDRGLFVGRIGRYNSVRRLRVGQD